MRPVLLLGLLSTGLLLRNAEAHEEPPCFPERTVLYSAMIYEPETLAPIGGLRAGQRVRIVRDRIGAEVRLRFSDLAQEHFRDHADLAEIEFDTPERVRAIVEREFLVVFAKQDIEIIPGFMWWPRGVPLQVTDNAVAGEVLVEGVALAGTPVPPSKVACDLLTAEVLLPLKVEWCEGATVVLPRQTRGRIVSWIGHGGLKLSRHPSDYAEPQVLKTEPDRLPQGPAKRNRSQGQLRIFYALVDTGTVIASKGSELLVEVVDEWQGVMVRGWSSQSNLSYKRSDGGSEIAIGCGSDWRWNYPKGARTLTVKAATALFADDGLRTPIVALPERSRVVLLEARGDRSYVQYSSAITLNRSRVILRGWIDRSRRR
jgi:hypothetical protein